MCSATASAQSADIDFFGTLSQGYINTNHNNYFGNSTRGSFDFREIGVGSAVRFTDDLRVSGLLLSRKAGTTADGKIEVDHLFFEYSPIKTQDATYGMRVGRLKIPFGFYNESRDIAESRPSILLPQSIYYDNIRAAMINADGVQAFGEYWNDGAYYKASLSYMKDPGGNDPQNQSYYFGTPQKGTLEVHTSVGAKLEYSTGKTDLAVFVSDFSQEYKAAPGDFLTSGHIDGTVEMWLSARHSFEHFILTSELFTAQARLYGFGQYFPNTTLYPFGMYAQAEWLTSEKLQFFTRYDFAASSSHDFNGKELSAMTGKPTSAFYAKDITVGGRYHFTPSTSLRAEMHFVNGTSTLPATDNLNSPVSPSYNIFALQLSHSF